MLKGGNVIEDNITYFQGCSFTLERLKVQWSVNLMSVDMSSLLIAPVNVTPVNVMPHVVSVNITDNHMIADVAFFSMIWR